MADYNDFVPRTECNLACQKLIAEDERQNRRIDKLEMQQEHITELTISVKELAIEVKNMVSKIDSQNTRIVTLESRDGEKWRGSVKTIITAAITGLVTSGITGIIALLFR